MKRNAMISEKVVKLVVFLLPFYFFAFFPLTASAKKHKQLVILHTNDTHSQIFPISSQLPDTMKAGMGGLPPSYCHVEGRASETS